MNTQTYNLDFSFPIDNDAFKKLNVQFPLSPTLRSYNINFRYNLSSENYRKQEIRKRIFMVQALFGVRLTRVAVSKFDTNNPIIISNNSTAISYQYSPEDEREKASIYAYTLGLNCRFKVIGRHYLFLETLAFTSSTESNKGRENRASSPSISIPEGIPILPEEEGNTQNSRLNTFWVGEQFSLRLGYLYRIGRNNPDLRSNTHPQN